MLDISRADRRVFAEWWWTVDRLLVAAVLVLMMCGLLLSMAASPSVATKYDVEQFYFVKRHALFILPAIGLMFVVSLLDARQMRRLCLIMFMVGLLVMLAALFIGPEIKGARRWIAFAGFKLQASEFVKPALVVLMAWLFAEGSKQPQIPGATLAAILLSIFAGLLLLQPDVGQTFLIAMVWGALFFVAGGAWIAVILLVGGAVCAVVAAYWLVPHVTERIDRFLDPASGDTYQIDIALESFRRGGWLGRGPGEGTVKQSLPDSHTDFVFAVAAEEFGILLCLLLLMMFAFTVMRPLRQAIQRTDMFERLAITGLASVIGLQAMINMAVNLHLMPAKGMTLPFISYGGSSMLATAFTLGLILGLTRQRPTPILPPTIMSREPVIAVEKKER